MLTSSICFLLCHFHLSCERILSCWLRWRCLRDVASGSQGGFTALICAAESGHSHCARLLIDAGADKEATTIVRAFRWVAGLICFIKISYYNFLFSIIFLLQVFRVCLAVSTLLLLPKFMLTWPILLRIAHLLKNQLFFLSISSIVSTLCLSPTFSLFIPHYRVGSNPIIFSF